MGFIKGRQTSDATSRILNIVHYAERSQMPSLLLSINAEKEQLKQFSTGKLSWAGRLASFKMILPQILYLFRLLPIPNYYLKTLLSFLSRYMCQGKKFWCCQSHLVSHRSIGGAGLVDIRYYSQAVHIDQLKFCLCDNDPPLWTEKEQAVVTTTNLLNLFICDSWKPRDISTLPSPSQASILAWRVLTKLPTEKKRKGPSNYSLQILKNIIPMISTKSLFLQCINSVEECRTINPKQLTPLWQSTRFPGNFNLSVHV